MKKIRFNLELANQSIRNMDDLQRNFIVQEILQLYKDQILMKWLQLQGENEKVKQIESIPIESSNIDKIIQLARILIDAEDTEIQKYVQQYEIFRRNRSRHYEFERLRNEKVEYIENLVNDYEIVLQKINQELEENYTGSLVTKIVDKYSEESNKVSESSMEHMKRLRLLLNELITNYYPFIQLNFQSLFTRYENQLIILLLLYADKKTHSLFTKEQVEELKSRLASALSSEDEQLSRYVKISERDTDGLWANVVDDNMYVIVVDVYRGLIGVESDKTIEYDRNDWKELLIPFRGMLFKSNIGNANVKYIVLGEELYE